MKVDPDYALCLLIFPTGNQSSIFPNSERSMLIHLFSSCKGKTYEIAISHKNKNKEYYFNYLTKANLIDLAKNEFPHKFRGRYRKRDLIANLKKSNPNSLINLQI